MPIPIIDLFAGPGGLGEGFCSLMENEQQPFFEIGLSIEKTEAAHRTLMLRSVFRRLRGTKDIEHYYRYIRGEMDEARFRHTPAIAQAFEAAAKEARCIELGKADEGNIDAEIRLALKGHENWVLIGGPPCQAYSLAGRSRRVNDKNFHNDEKHFLYKEYLRIIQVHKPTIFVMENVKGLLSSKHLGSSIFEKIISDLSSPAVGLEYEIRSFTKQGDSNSLQPTDFLIHAEKYGIPQSRHRVILLGVRKGSEIPQHQLLRPVATPVTVADAIDDLPRIRSRLSKKESQNAWCEAVQDAPIHVKGWQAENEYAMIQSMHQSAIAATGINSIGGAFIPTPCRDPKKTTELHQWLHDQSLGGVCQHEARAHMSSDLARYLFAATFADMHGYSPRLDIFPPKLLPKHMNVQHSVGTKSIPFKDRFRVQCKSEPATTVVAHIAKDGHYYIHYDPTQCRSLTVREAARIQTFPDNYFFEGNRTEQYTQIGNAVPPLLAYKLAHIVHGLLSEMDRKKPKQTDAQKTKTAKLLNLTVSEQDQASLLIKAD